MRRFLALGGLALVLAGCGVDGAPIPPDDRERQPSGIHLSGSVKVGVAGGSGSPARLVSGF